MSNLKEIIKQIYLTTLREISPYILLKDNLKYLELSTFNNIYFISIGKAANTMTQAFIDTLENKLSKGLVITPFKFNLKNKKIKIIVSSHPIPSIKSLNAAYEIINFLKILNKNDLLLLGISGGTSSLVSLPIDGLTLKDKQLLNKLLLNCGANIQEINKVRKFFSKIKGGKLAKYIYPNHCYSFILSDVIGDDIATIGSGLTHPDTIKVDEVYSILNKYNLIPLLSSNIKNVLYKKKISYINKKYFQNINNRIIGNNLIALKKIADRLEKKNFKPLILTSSLQGEAKECAKFFISIVREIINSNNPLVTPCALILGGETTVTVKGIGIGGRNHEFALSCLIELQKINLKNKFVLLTAATDGKDGICNSAGVILDNYTLKKAIKLNPENYLKNNDSYTFFKNLNATFITGDTGNNIGDIVILVLNK